MILNRALVTPAKTLLLMALSTAMLLDCSFYCCCFVHWRELETL